MDAECILTTSFFVLVNGSPSRLFKVSRGIRQDDSLSPFLFTIVLEALRKLLVKAKELGAIERFQGTLVVRQLLAYSLQTTPFSLAHLAGKKF